MGLFKAIGKSIDSKESIAHTVINFCKLVVSYRFLAQCMLASVTRQSPFVLCFYCDLWWYKNAVQSFDMVSPTCVAKDYF